MILQIRNYKEDQQANHTKCKATYECVATVVTVAHMLVFYFKQTTVYNCTYFLAAFGAKDM